MRKKLNVLIFLVMLLIGAMCVFTACDKNNTSSDSKSFGLGDGINAFTAKSPIDNQQIDNIFDFNKLPIKNTDIGSTEINSTVRDNVIEKIRELNKGYTLSSSVNVNLGGLFSAGYESKFSINNSIKSSHKAHQYFYTMFHNTQGRNYYLDGFKNTQNYQQYLSTNFLNDLNKFQQNRDYEGFIQKYGTHIRTSVIYGGQMEIYYNIFSETDIKSNEINTVFKNAVKASISGGDASISAGVEFERKLQDLYHVNTENSTSFFNAKLFGGEVVACSSFEELAISYPQWANSLNNENNWKVIDVAEQGLVPIWEYIPNEYNVFKNILIARFKEEANKNVERLLNKMNFEDGTEERPYKIYNKQDLIKVLSSTGNQTTGIHYKLMADLNMGDWGQNGSDSWGKSNGTPENAFKGIFDGNNHTVTYTLINSRSNTNSKEKDTTTYGYGLFSSLVNATIKNLNVETTIDVRNGYANCSVAGAIAGYAMNSTISNCTVSGKVDQGEINCYYVYSGGLVGCAYVTQFWDCTNNAEVYAYFKSGQGGRRGWAAGICGASDGSVKCNRCVNNSTRFSGSNKRDDYCCNR